MYIERNLNYIVLFRIEGIGRNSKNIAITGIELYIWTKITTIFKRRVSVIL